MSGTGPHEEPCPGTAAEGWQEWLAEFEHTHGRPLRVLHIGNIANNAYINAKIQRRHGIEADVSCHDYFHVMGCPEWEDAPFTGDVGDPFFPDWWAVDLHGFERPRWFAQGRLVTCQHYLLAVRRGQRVRAALLWRKLRFEVWLRCRDSRTADEVRALVGARRAGWMPGAALAATRRRLETLPLPATAAVSQTGPALQADAQQGRTRLVALVLASQARLAHRLALARFHVRTLRSLVSSSTWTTRRKSVLALRAAWLVVRGTSWRTAALSVFPRRLGGLARTPEQHALVAAAHAYAEALAQAPSGPEPAAAVEPGAAPTLPAELRHSAHLAAGTVPATAPPAPARSAATPPAAAPVPVPAAEPPAAAAAEPAAPAPAGPAGARLPYRLARVVEAFARAFPQRPPLTGTDLAGWAPAIDGWSELLDHYDIVQGYASDPIVPLLAGKRAFTAYEHGTLRDLPFVDDTLGRIVSIGFHSAPVTFVTNLDVPPRARLLGIPDERIVCLPHAVDDAALAALELAPHTPPLAHDGPLVAFAPARHDWVDGDPRSCKGNDVFLRGLAEARTRGIDARAVLIDWGRDTAASRALCKELGLEPHVEWIGLLDKQELRRRYLQAHCVVDQFALPAFGSVTFEALALGCRVVTRLDSAAAAAFFGEPPPLLAAATPSEVAHALALVGADLADASGRGEAAAAWFRRRHSSRRIVELQVDAYRRVLADTQAHVPVAPAGQRAHLACPACHGPLDWDDAAGRCPACGSAYPVVRGIPRFVAQPEHGGIAQTQTAFDFEHRLYERSAWTRFDPTLVEMFLTECGLPRSFFPGKRTLDAGCGSGRWSWALAELGADVTGIDLTEGGIEAAHQELGRRPNARFAQADLFDLPFAPGTFDLVVSWGVLHHTPSTKAAFDRLVPLVAPGGTLFVMVYEDMGDHVQKGTNIVRWLMRRLPPRLRWSASRLLVLRSHALFRLLSPWLMVAYWNPQTSPADFDSYRFGVYDAYSPRYNFVHTGDEVIGWFEGAGFVEVERVATTAGAVRVRGVRPAQE